MPVAGPAGRAGHPGGWGSQAVLQVTQSVLGRRGEAVGMCVGCWPEAGVSVLSSKQHPDGYNILYQVLSKGCEPCIEGQDGESPARSQLGPGERDRLGWSWGWKTGSGLCGTPPACPWEGWSCGTAAAPAPPMLLEGGSISCFWPRRSQGPCHRGDPLIPACELCSQPQSRLGPCLPELLPPAHCADVRCLAPGPRRGGGRVRPAG